MQSTVYLKKQREKRTRETKISKCLLMNQPLSGRGSIIGSFRKLETPPTWEIQICIQTEIPNELYCRLFCSLYFLAYVVLVGVDVLNSSLKRKKETPMRDSNALVLNTTLVWRWSIHVHEFSVFVTLTWPTPTQHHESWRITATQV